MTVSGSSHPIMTSPAGSAARTSSGGPAAAPPGGRAVTGLRLLRVLTALTVASVWLLVIVGGIVRVTESGLGCPDWPLCTSAALPLPTMESVIEYSHRVIVAWVSVCVVAVLWVVMRHFRGRRDLTWPAWIAAILLPGQAVLGWAAIEFDLAGQMVSVHFMVGMTFFASTAVTMAAAMRPVRPDGSTAAVAGISRAFAIWAWIGMAIGLGVVLLGTTVMATGAWTACGTDWPACNGGFASGGGLAIVQVAHRMFAYTLAVIAIVLAIIAARGRGPRILGMLPLTGVTIQISFGVWVVVSGSNFTIYRIASGAHVAGAAFVWGLLILLVVVCEQARPVVDPPATSAPGGAPVPREAGAVTDGARVTS